MTEISKKNKTAYIIQQPAAQGLPALQQKKQKKPICLLQLKGSFAQKKKAIKKTNKTKIQSIFTVLFRLFDGEQRERMSLPEGEAKPKYILSAFSLFGRGWDENFYPRPGQGYEFHVQETRKQLLS